MNLEQSIRRMIRVPDRRPIWEWANKHIKFPPGSPFPGAFRIENAPWLKRVFEAWKDPKVRRITITGVPQESGKTVAAQVAMLWQTSEDAAPIGFYSATQTLVKAFVDTRLESMIDSCGVFKSRIHDQQKSTITFKDGTYLLLLGAESERSRQSHTLKCVIKDEHYLYDQTWSREIDNRTRAYAESEDWKVLELGTGPDEGSPHDINHNLGTCEEWEVESPYSEGEYFRMIWNKDEGGVWGWDEIYRDDESLDVPATAATAHIVCPHTGKRIEWDRQTAKQMMRSGRWVQTNPDADGSHVSIRIDAFTPAKTPWPEIVKEWLQAAKGRRVGATQSLKDFVVFRLAQTWKDKAITEKRALPYGGYTRAEAIAERMPDERVRLAAIDYQHGRGEDVEHYWFVVRAFAANGDSRLVDCGKVYEVAELNERLLAAGVREVPLANIHTSRVFIDCAFKPSVVFENCMRFRWLGIRGEDRDTKNRGGQFMHTFRHRGEVVKVWRNYSELKYHELGVGRSSQFQGLAPWRSINNQGCQQILDELLSGNAASHTVPDDIEEFCPEYAGHIAAVGKVNVSKDPIRPLYRWENLGRSNPIDDHLRDCEKYLVGGALVAELFGKG